MKIDGEDDGNESISMMLDRIGFDEQNHSEHVIHDDDDSKQSEENTRNRTKNKAVRAQFALSFCRSVHPDTLRIKPCLLFRGFEYFTLSVVRCPYPHSVRGTAYPDFCCFEMCLFQNSTAIYRSDPENTAALSTPPNVDDNDENRCPNIGSRGSITVRTDSCTVCAVC